MGSKYVKPLLNPMASFDNARVGNNYMSLSLADYMDGPLALTSDGGAASAALGGYSPNSFVGDLGDLGVQPTGFMESDFMKNMLGWKGQDGTQRMGWGGMALGAGQALFGAWDGMRNYELQKDQLAFSKDAFAKNWDAQRKTTNSQLQDRQQARLASREGASSNPYQSVGDYMKQNGIA